MNKKVIQDAIGNIMSRNMAHNAFGGSKDIDNSELHNILQHQSMVEQQSMLHTSEDIDKLKHGKIPSNVLYSQAASQVLTKLDNNRLFLYTQCMGNGAFEMFHRLGGSGRDRYPHLSTCIGTTSHWIDIGTGNGIITNMVALQLYTVSNIKRFENMMYKGNTLLEPLTLHCCDLSKDSLQVANSIANDHFYQLKNLMQLDYHEQGFESLLEDTSHQTPRLITMFNVLTNFDNISLNDTFKKLYDLMKSGDVFIPTFFNYPSYHYEDYHDTYGYNDFEELSLKLYDNQETKDWIVHAFSTSYHIPQEHIQYHVSREHDGRPYIKVSVSVDDDIDLIVDNALGGTLPIQTQCNNEGRQEFLAFKSYRTDREYLQAELSSIGFGIDGWLESKNDLQIAPILYKK